jgi:hypothetical protein
MKGLLLLACILLGLILLVLCGVPPWGIALIVFGLFFLLGMAGLVRLIFKGECVIYIEAHVPMICSGKALRPFTFAPAVPQRKKGPPAFRSMRSR